MRRILALAFLLIFAALIIWGCSNRSVVAVSDWGHVRLGRETLALGTLDSVENGYAVFVQDVKGKQETRRVHLVRLADGQRGTIDPIVHIAEADEVNLFDVSVGKSGVVALAGNAIIKTAPVETVVALLMLYDARGSLLSVQRLLKRGQMILKLKVDDDNTVWAISFGDKNEEPATAPFLYKYTDLGATVGVVYTRAMLPEISVLRPYFRGVGSVGFGTTKDNVYCWIPNIEELVVMAKDGSGMRRLPLPAPRPAGLDAVVFRMYHTEGGTSFADVKYRGPCKDSSGKSYRPATTFAYDGPQATWRELRYNNLPPVVLVGVDGERPILMSKWKTPADQAPPYPLPLDSSYQLFKP